jgi:hypothetical protein
MLIYMHCLELMKLVDSHGSLSLLFVIRVMVKHFVNHAFDVWTRLIVVVPLNCYCSDFREIS